MFLTHHQMKISFKNKLSQISKKICQGCKHLKGINIENVSQISEKMYNSLILREMQVITINTPFSTSR